MEKKRGTTIAVVAALIIAVVSLGVAFATFSTTLTINGNATVLATKWDIYFAENGYSGQTAPSKPADSSTLGTMSHSNTISGYTDTVDLTATSATYSSPTSITWQAAFKSAGDKVVWEFYAVNAGDFDSQVNSTPQSIYNAVSPATGTAISCTGGADATEAASVCSHIHYGLYTDSALTIPVSNSTTLAHRSAQKYYLAVWLDESYGGLDGKGLATASVTTNAITTTLTYGQTGTAQ